MITENPFVLPVESYTRRVNFMLDYLNDTAFYISRMTGDDFEDVKNYIRSEMRPGGAFEVKDPRVLVLEANQYGDRDKKIITLGQFIKEALDQDDILTPTFTTFYQPEEKKSFQPAYMRKNIALRKKFKHAMYECEAKGDKEGEDINNKKQNNRKTSNNSVSGTYTIGSTPLANPTAHAVLTSTCRITSGYANANNEKMISGNRHYWAPRIVFNNITSIVTHTDYEQLQAVMTKYQLHYPTPEDALDCIRRGAMKYWRDERQYQEVLDYLKRLSPLELAAFVYTGDLYHLRKHNDRFIRDFFEDFTKPIEGTDLQEPHQLRKQINEDFFIMALNTHLNEVKGKDVVMMSEKDNDNPLYRKVVATARYSEEVAERYSDFIKTFFRTTNVPASLSYFPSSIRHSALTSDTDSTIFTTQEWVLWFNNGSVVGDRANRIAGAICNFASQTIIHLLALMSANLGIKSPDLKVIAMKNEFKFEPFIPADVSKHYMAFRTIQEGNVYGTPKKEVKGVHMKAANAPIAVNKASEEMMLDIMNTINRGEKIDIMKILKQVADSERTVIASLKSGSPEYCRYAKVKEPQSYAQGPSKSPYQYHTFWNEVFGPKYGTVQEPPYLMVKVKSDELSSPNKIREWTDTFKDRELAERVLSYIKRTGKKQLKTFYVPEAIVENQGIPDEILEAVNYRSVVKNVHITYYVILSTLGFYIDDDKVNRLVSDFH